MSPRAFCAFCACVVFALAVGNTASARECVADSPAAVARWLYLHGAQLDDPGAVAPALSPALLQLLQGEKECVETTREQCAIDSDIWTNSQDGKISGPVRFTQDSRASRAAIVKMRFRFLIDDDVRKAFAQAATILLARDSPGACWQVDDIVGPGGRSLKATLRRAR